MSQEGNISQLLRQYVIEKPISMLCIVLLLLISSLNLVLTEPINCLSLIPVNTFIANKFVWNILTSAFYERHFIKLLLDCVLALFTVKSLDIASYEQFALYLLICTLVTSFSTSAVYFISFFISKIEAPLVQPTYGFGGLYIAILMYARSQSYSESIHFTIPQLTYQHYPIFYLSIQLIFYVLNLNLFTNDLLFAVISLFVSWTYLRFVYRFDDDTHLGNNSEEFAFVAMFPDVRICPII